ncbi:unnamed protein product, partial [Rangifer tarandus platyrhynchus]
KHLLVHLLHGHVVSENDGHSQTAATAEIKGDITCLVPAIGWVSSTLLEPLRLAALAAQQSKAGMRTCR